MLWCVYSYRHDRLTVTMTENTSCETRRDTFTVLFDIFTPPRRSELYVMWPFVLSVCHPVSGINSRILSVSLASHVSTHLLIHLSPHLCYHHHSHHPSLLHCFQAQNLPFQQILPTLDFFYLPDCLRDNGTIVLFLLSHFNFLFVPCGGTKLATRQLFTAR